MAAEPSKLQFAVIGCGRMGHMHTQRLHADGRGEVTALFDENVRAAESLRDQWAPHAKISSRFDELLECEVDAAVICTPTTSHFDQVRACRQQGWHVLCEKPLADTRQRIRTLVDESRGGEPQLAVAYQRRHWATYRTLRREIRSGRFGPVQAVTSVNAERWQQTIAGTWRDDPAVNRGGFVGDAGSHKIDAVFYITGLRPTQVFASSERCGSNVEVITTLSARLDGGIPLTMSFVGNSESFVEDVHLHCARGDLMLRNGEIWTGRDNRVERLTLDLQDSDPDAGFLDLLLDREENLAPPECALPVFDLTAGILESGRTGGPIRIEAVT